MRRTAFVEAVETWGERHLGTSDLVKVLTHLSVEERMSAPQIAVKLSSEERSFSAETVRRTVRRFGVKDAPPTFETAVKELGYSSIKDFFLSPKIARKPHGEVAKMTGHTIQTVWNHWNNVRREVRQQCLAGAV